nr:MAG TPA: hypothetical protein [Bacteriophage sp.]
MTFTRNLMRFQCKPAVDFKGVFGRLIYSWRTMP